MTDSASTPADLAVEVANYVHTNGFSALSLAYVEKQLQAMFDAGVASVSTPVPVPADVTVPDVSPVVTKVEAEFPAVKAKGKAKS